MSEYYDRQGREIDLMAWAEAFEDKAQRIVGKTTVGDSEVSTVWLGLNHAWGDGPPLIFETMIFGGRWDQWQDRYSTEAQALEAHGQVVVALELGEEPQPYAR